MEWNESDLNAIAKIQEVHGGTPKEARDIYRKRVLRLANPDVEGRATIILESYLRMNGKEVVAVENAISGQVKQTRREKKDSKKAMKKLEVKRKEKKHKITAANREKCKRCNHIFERHHIKNDMVECDKCDCKYRKPGIRKAA